MVAEAMPTNAPGRARPMSEGAMVAESHPVNRPCHAKFV